MNQRSDLPNSTRKGLKFALCYPYFSFLEARLGLWICPKHNKVIPLGHVVNKYVTSQQLLSPFGAIAGPGPPERLNRLLHAIASLLFLMYIWIIHLMVSANICEQHEFSLPVKHSLFIGWTEIVEMLLYILLFGLDFMCFITLVPSRKKKKKNNTYFLERIASPGLEYILLYAVQLQIVHWKNFACLMKHGL